jgi:hypothetical protein
MMLTFLLSLSASIIALPLTLFNEDANVLALVLVNCMLLLLLSVLLEEWCTLIDDDLRLNILLQ